MKKISLFFATLCGILLIPGMAGAQTISQAVQVGDTAQLSQLIGAGANVNQADSNGTTALMLAASLGDTIMLHTLINSGAVVEAINNNGASALIIASQSCYVDVVAILISNGGDASRRDAGNMRGYDYVTEASNSALQAETPRNSRIDKSATFALLYNALGYNR